MGTPNLSKSRRIIFKDFDVRFLVKDVVKWSNDRVHVKFRRVVWRRPVISAVLALTRAQHLGTYHSPAVQAKPLRGCLGVNPVCIRVQPSGLWT